MFLVIICREERRFDIDAENGVVNRCSVERVVAQKISIVPRELTAIMIEGIERKKSGFISCKIVNLDGLDPEKIHEF